MRFSKLCLFVAVGLLAATQLAVAGPWERNAGSKTMGDYTGSGSGRVNRRSYSYAPATNATNAVAATPATPAPVAAPAPVATPAPVAKPATPAPAKVAAPAEAPKPQAAVAQQPNSTTVRRYSYAPQQTYSTAPSYGYRRGISGPRYINAGRKIMGEY